MAARVSRQEERLAAVEPLHLQHLSPVAIAKTVGCSTTQVRRDIETIRHGLKVSLERSLQEHKAETLARLGLMFRTCWETFAASVTPKETSFTEKRIGPGEGSRATMRREARAGDPRYLETALRIEKFQAKLLGLDAPERCTVSVESEEFQSKKDVMKEVWRLLGSPSPWSLSDHPVDPSTLPPGFPGTPPDPSRPDAFKRMFGFTYEELSEQEPET